MESPISFSPNNQIETMAPLLTSSCCPPRTLFHYKYKYANASGCFHINNNDGNRNRSKKALEIKERNFKLNGRSSSSSNATSSANEVGLLGKRDEDEKEEENMCLVESEYGWKVRRLSKDQDEMKRVAFIQADAFHTPVTLFDDLFFEFFKAEVLSGLLYKLRNSSPNRYACLVAEPSSCRSESMDSIKKQLVGVVDVTVLRDADVLQHLQDADEYLYVSGLAVSKRFRRQRIGSALLKACEVLAVIWGFKYLVLRAYEDDVGARNLYSNAGYQVVSADLPWFSSWIGRKRRVLMVKRSNYNLLF